MTDYTPTTEVVKDACCFPRQQRLGEPRILKRVEFDRWLAEVKAEAWDEGCRDGAKLALFTHSKYWPNPYRPNHYRQDTNHD